MIQKQLIKYRLNPDGSVPDFLCTHGLGGIFLKYDPNTPSPQDHIMIGLSEYPVTVDTPGIVGILTTKQELSDYLTELLDGATEPDPNDPTGEPVPVNIPAKVDWSWGVYTSENNL